MRRGILLTFWSSAALDGGGRWALLALGGPCPGADGAAIFSTRLAACYPASVVHFSTTLPR